MSTKEWFVTIHRVFLHCENLSQWSHKEKGKIETVVVQPSKLLNTLECDIINPPDPSIFIFQPLSSISNRLYLLGLFNCYACFAFVDNLCNSAHGQVHSSDLSPSICYISSLRALKRHELINPSSLIHLLVVFIFCSGVFLPISSHFLAVYCIMEFFQYASPPPLAIFWNLFH